MSQSPPREERNSHIRGVVIALVTDIDDPKDMGRVRLTYPWRNHPGESGWVRVATTMAGPDGGTYFVPAVDDEVLVAFENGDIHHPYVVGALWNGVDAPPHADPKNVRGIRSRSGHTLTFDDTENAGTIEIETSGGHKILLDDSSGGDRVEIVDAGKKNKLTLNSDGTVEVTAGTTLRLSAPSVELSSAGELTIDAGGPLTLGGKPIKLN